jgi:phosphatidylethanolamine/phosphatidyl-N-methylethanolamine N-methyltransferase
MADTRILLREFLRAPMQVGAVAPSGLRLATELTDIVPDRDDATVVEIGPGTGVLSAQIQRRLGGRGRHIAVEINPRLAGLVADRWPAVEVVCGDAAKVPEILAARGLRSADAVVSSLPWACFTPDRLREILAGVCAALAPDGCFTTVAYVHARWSPPGRRLWRLLRTSFDDVVVGEIIWANVPPAVVYRASGRRAS